VGGLHKEPYKGRRTGSIIHCAAAGGIGHFFVGKYRIICGIIHLFHLQYSFVKGKCRIASRSPGVYTQRLIEHCSLYGHSTTVVGFYQGVLAHLCKNWRDA
jgi:hypothetical protein